MQQRGKRVDMIDVGMVIRTIVKSLGSIPAFNISITGEPETSTRTTWLPSLTTNETFPELACWALPVTQEYARPSNLPLLLCDDRQDDGKNGQAINSKHIGLVRIPGNHPLQVSQLGGSSPRTSLQESNQGQGSNRIPITFQVVPYQAHHQGYTKIVDPNRGCLSCNRIRTDERENKNQGQ